MANLIKVDKNGTKYYEGYVPCDRCNGEGIYYIGTLNGKPLPSYVDSGVCFKCGGRGKIVGKWKEYTPEHEAKLEAQRRRRAEKQAVERKAKEAERRAKQEEEEAKARAEAERVKAEKAKSQYVGNIGERLELKVVYKFSAWYETKNLYGYGMATHYIHTFKAGDDTIVWKTTNPICLDEEAEITLRGTVKEHSEYRDEKQTILTRCKVIE